MVELSNAYIYVCIVQKKWILIHLEIRILLLMKQVVLTISFLLIQIKFLVP